MALLPQVGVHLAESRSRQCLLANLIGEADGHVISHIISHDFEAESAAIDWICGAGLADFKDQTMRGEVWFGGQMAWTRSGLQTPNSSVRVRNGSLLVGSPVWPYG